MAELSVAASVVGVVVPALHGVKLLLEDIQNLRDVPKTIERLGNDARSVETALSTLQGVGDSEWESLGTLVAAESKTTISTCTSACNQFRTDLQRWTRRSDDGKLALTDRAKVAFLRQGHIKTMSEQLQNCKLSVTSMVGVANLYSSIRHTRITEEIRESILIRQTEVSAAIAVANKQMAVVQDRLADLDLSDDGEDDGESIAGRDEALRRLREERMALDSSRKLLRELLFKSQEEALASTVDGKTGASSVTFGNNNSGFQAHTVNGGIRGMTFGQK